LFYRPGLVALEWLDVFPDIYISVVDDLSDDEIENLSCNSLSENKFEIFGYYATACELLAEWIENHADDDHDNPIPPGDGLRCDDTVFVWGGKPYTIITPTMVPVLKVLLQAYRQCREATTDEFEAALGVEIKNGFGSLFRVGKSPHKTIHPVRSIILPPHKKGRKKYRLIDPVEAK